MAEVVCSSVAKRLNCQNVFRVTKVYSERPKFTRHGQSSMWRGSETPELPKCIQNRRSLFGINKVYSQKTYRIQISRSSMCFGSETPKLGKRIQKNQSLFRITKFYSEWPK